MLRNAVVVHYAGVVPMLGLAMVFLWFRLTGVGVRDLCMQLVLTVGGYLRPRPDPTVENALRTAFTDLDRQLTALLGDRLPRDAPDE